MVARTGHSDGSGRTRRLMRGFTAATIVAAGIAAGAGAVSADPQAALSDLTAAQARDVEKIIHDYIIQHPEVILESMQNYDAKQAAAKAAKQGSAVAANRAAIYDDPSSYVAGNPKGDVTIVEFFDYQCGYCKRTFEPLMNELKADGNVRLILKEFPILGPESVVATHAALASMKQGKYFELHQALFRNKTALTDARIMQIAASVGIDTDRLKKDMSDPEIAKTIARNEKLASELSIDGTPGFIIGGNVQAGSLNADELTAAVKDARARCGANC